MTPYFAHCFIIILTIKHRLRRSNIIGDLYSIFWTCRCQNYEPDIRNEKHIFHNQMRTTLLIENNLNISPTHKITTSNMSINYNQWVLRNTSDQRRVQNPHYVKSGPIWSYSGPHFSRIFPHLDWIWTENFLLTNLQSISSFSNLDRLI